MRLALKDDCARDGRGGRKMDWADGQIDGTGERQYRRLMIKQQTEIQEKQRERERERDGKRER